MTREEVIACAEVYEKVVFDLEPGRRYHVRAVCDVFANEEELARYYPRRTDIVTLIDDESGAHKKAGPAQLQPANPEMLAIKLQARALNTEK